MIHEQALMISYENYPTSTYTDI